MTFDFRMKIDIKTEQYLKAIEENIFPPIVKKYALAIQGDAAKNAPVDTGALKNSMIAEEKNKNNWTISDGVTYGVFQELGTSRGVKAKHFLGGACEKFADKFFNELKEALK